MSIGIWQLVIILVIVLLLFGTKKVRNLGSDLGGAIKSFRSAVRDQEEPDGDKSGKNDHLDQKGNVIEGEVEQKEKNKV